MKKKKNHKLVIQVGIMSISILIATLVFSAVSVFFLSRDIYLSSKNEMIDLDLDSGSKNLAFTSNFDWFISYQKEHPKEVVDGPTFEEQNLYTSDKYSDLLLDFLYSGTVDPEKQTPEIQLFLAREIYKMINIESAGSESNLLDCARRYVLIVSNEHESYLVSEIGNDDLRDSIGTTISYEATEHSAVKKILSGELSEQGQTIYEVYNDPKNGKSYYIGYTPVIMDGKVACTFCLWYDWSAFRNKLMGRVTIELVIGSLVLFALNALLMFFVYKKAISPVLKVKSGVQDYMNDKDSASVTDKMRRIKIRNEIGVLADSFSDLAVEIDRYTAEILDLNAEKERTAAELMIAAQIQTDMIPGKFPAFPERKEFDLYASMNPAKEVGGDFYDFFLIDDDHLALVIADVSGKGIPASLFMMSSMIILRERILTGKRPSEILKQTNESICKNNKSTMFVTVWLGILEISTGKLTASNGGHEYPAVCSGGKFELLEYKHGVALGLFNGVKYTDYEITLKKGDGIFVYTDGVAEANNADKNLFGTDRLIEALNRSPDASPEDILKNVRSAVDGFVKEEPQFDDLTMLCLKYYGKDSMKDGAQ